MVKQPFHGQRQGFQRLAFLHDDHLFKGVDIVGMHREQADELVHAFVHVAVELGEGRQVLAYPGLLLAGLFEQPFSHHEFDVLVGNEDLLEAILDSTDTVGHEGKTRAVKDGFLHAGHETKPQVPANLADFAEEVQVQNEFLILAGAQVIEQFVHHEKQTVVRKRLVESGHHLLESVLVAGYLVDGGEGVVDAHCREVFFQLGHKDVPQGHGGSADLGTDYPEPAADFSGGIRHGKVVEAGGKVGILRECGND